MSAVILWMREVNPRDAPFLRRALRQTQRMMKPALYLAEHALAPDVIAPSPARAPGRS